MKNSIQQVIGEDQKAAAEKITRERLGFVATDARYVGELWRLDYEQAVVMVHDAHRAKVGGIPNQCFLVATRMRADGALQYSSEDASLILLRVLDAAALPAESEMSRIRAEAGQRAVGTEKYWDEQSVMDGYTANFLSFAGLSCRVVGTFYLEQTADGGADRVRLRFGGDLSNFYPNRALKVYKPTDEALRMIVNYRDTTRAQSHVLRDKVVPVGHVRYASTNRLQQGIDTVEVSLAPTDLLGQKTALFGMTRTGKSNTTKIIAKSIFALRFDDPTQGRIGQLIFDYNGEYANENTQDGKGGLSATALKNVWKTNSAGKSSDVVTYGTFKHPLDPSRNMMLFNYYDDTMLQAGKDVIDAILQTESNSIYVNNFRDVAFSRPLTTDISATTRYKRLVLAYHALLARANFSVPPNLVPNVDKLFGKDLIDALNAAAANGQDSEGKYEFAALHLKNGAKPTWPQLGDAMVGLWKFIQDKNSGFAAFNSGYMAKSSTGDRWNDSSLDKVLDMLWRYNGPALVGRAAEQHAAGVSKDYRDAIYDDLLAGRLVIVDQSQGNAEINKASAQRVMTRILAENQRRFAQAETPPEILVYIEEAHNLLPHSSEEDMRDVWVRTAKEGAKLHIGLLYITQEVSSIQKNILKNTANWFIGHLNNTDETKELRKYYDFADFEPSILKAQDQGFLRVKTISNMFVVPVQIERFTI